MDEQETIPLSEQVEESIATDIRGQGKTEVYEIRDASSESAKVLVPQLASDASWLAEGRNDFRRLTNIKEIDPIWMSWFWNKRKEQGRRWCRGFIEQVCNFSYSVGGERAILTVEMQRANTGIEPKKKEDNRNWMERNITKKGQDPSKRYLNIPTR